VIPRLTIRGEDSDLLLPETLAQMASEGSATHVVPDSGHAPALMDAPTIAVIRTFLTA
jgi:pimeloyl-ACP methyl ester carboxylesterase